MHIPFQTLKISQGGGGRDSRQLNQAAFTSEEKGNSTICINILLSEHLSITSEFSEP